MIKSYDEYYFLKKFEKVLKNEFKGNYKVKEYNNFKNKFNKLINTKIKFKFNINILRRFLQSS